MKNRSDQSVADELFHEIVTLNPGLSSAFHFKVQEACRMVVQANPEGGFWTLYQALTIALPLTVEGFDFRLPSGS